LVWSRFPSYINSQVRSYIEGATIDLGITGKDNTYGYGPIVLTKIWSLMASSTVGGSVTEPGEGTFDYNDMEEVNIVATADTGYHFVNWTGDANTIADVNAASTTITMDANYSIQANFAPNQYSLTINTSGHGTVAKDPNQATYHYGDTVQLTANAEPGWTFDSWSGDLGGSDNPANLQVTGNMNVTATFVLQYTITASADPNGSIDPCGTFAISSGQDQLFTAKPNTGYEVDTWYVDSNSVQTGGDTFLLINIQADHNVYVTFIPVPEIRVSFISYDYDSVAIGVYKDTYLYIYNDGAANLYITDLNGLSLTDFSLINPREIPFMVEPFSNQYLKIRFEPSSLGESSATLSIANNDSDENPIEVDLLGTGVEPRIIFVDANATGIGDGSSWMDAYIYLQDALSDAELGDHIWVAEGVYKPDQGKGITPGDPNFAFELINGVSIYGGFPSGGDPNWNDRYPNAYETILSADLNGDDKDDIDPCDLLSDPNRVDNSFHVIVGSYLTDASRLDGLTITGGNANSSSYPDYYGGGLYHYGGTIGNCKINRNSANNGGGGIYHFNGTIMNCSVTENSSNSSGGGLGYCVGGTIINCTVAYNAAANYGGGIYYCKGPINACNISSNTASYGGGLSSCDGTISNCTISCNVATSYGAGVFFCDGELTSCIVASNDTDGYGGGVYLSHADITACTIADNYATDYGAGIRACYGLIDNCIIWGNVTESGGDQISSSEPNYSCIQDWTTGYHLSSGSPCIDTGDPNYVAEANELDIDGDARVIAGRIDMGADEYTFGELSDFSDDGIVNFEDFSILAYYWQDYVCDEPDWCEGCDYDESGTIDHNDLSSTFAIF